MNLPIPSVLRPTVPLALAFALLGGAQVAHAQSIVGTVTDESTGQGIDAAAIQLLHANGEPVGPGTVANSEGRFTMPLPGPGVYKVRITRIGYGASETVAFELLPDDGPVTLSIIMVPQLITLGDILVDAEAETGNTLRGIALESYRQRERLGFGRFYNKDDLAMWGDRPFDLVFKTLPNVQVGGRTSREVALVRGGESCPIRWFLDGIRVRPFPSESEIPVEIELLQANDIEAVEMYRTEFEVPFEFGAPPMDPTCAAVVVWTKRR